MRVPTQSGQPHPDMSRPSASTLSTASLRTRSTSSSRSATPRCVTEKSTQRPAPTRRRRPGGPTDGLATFGGIGETHDEEDRRCDGARFAQPARRRSHVFLHRGLRAGEELLPGLRQDLLGAGGISVDTGRLPWLGEHGWLPAEPSYNLLSLTARSSSTW